MPIENIAVHLLLETKNKKQKAPRTPRLRAPSPRRRHYAPLKITITDMFSGAYTNNGMPTKTAPSSPSAAAPVKPPNNPTNPLGFASALKPGEEEAEKAARDAAAFEAACVKIATILPNAETNRNAKCAAHVNKTALVLCKGNAGKYLNNKGALSRDTYLAVQTAGGPHAYSFKKSTGSRGRHATRARVAVSAIRGFE